MQSIKINIEKVVFTRHVEIKKCIGFTTFSRKVKRANSIEINFWNKEIFTIIGFRIIGTEASEI